MTHKKRLPMGLVAAGLLLALATIGIVNGLWSKNLVVNGTVTTGDVNVRWFAAACEDQYNWFGDQSPNPGLQAGEYLDKDVAWTTTQINTNDDQILEVTINNGYPSYVVHCTMDWYNIGSIPVTFRGFEVVPTGGGDALTGCSVIDNGDTKTLVCDQLTVIFVDGITTQIEPCGPLQNPLFCEKAEHSLYVHVEQPAAQSNCWATGSGDPWQIGGGGTSNNAAALHCDGNTQVDYHFQVKLCVAQWNEAADYTQCKTSLQHEGPGGPGGVGDPDWDGILDASDNCPTVFNPNQANSGGNPALGDRCDPAPDEDGVAYGDDDTVLG